MGRVVFYSAEILSPREEPTDSTVMMGPISWGPFLLSSVALAGLPSTPFVLFLRSRDGQVHKNVFLFSSSAPHFPSESLPFPTPSVASHQRLHIMMPIYPFNNLPSLSLSLCHRLPSHLSCSVSLSSSHRWQDKKENENLY